MDSSEDSQRLLRKGLDGARRVELQKAVEEWLGSEWGEGVALRSSHPLIETRDERGCRRKEGQGALGAVVGTTTPTSPEVARRKSFRLS